ncbi:glycosyltransferase [bacterium]|nr:glycosyltransferase [bacterium]
MTPSLPQNGVAIVIPVYNNFSDAIRCLASVYAHTDPDVPILIFDDASTEGVFEDQIATLPQRSNISVERFSENLGFTKTVNRGITRCAPADVVILNSDTVVGAGWLLKLTDAAASEERVGSVTPFTNNGVICSLPVFCKENSIPPGESLQSMNELLEELADDEERYLLPTCVGFCTYFRREALDAVGLLDEENFPRGYGEENDLSCRLEKANYTNILAPDTFVFHAGGGSFREERHSLMEAGEEALRRLHPTYYPKVSRFVRENPLRELHLSIQEKLALRHDQRAEGRILHLLHNGPYEARRDPVGGTERHVQSIQELLPEFSHWSLVRDRSHYLLQGCGVGATPEYALPVESTVLSEILSRHHFELIHVHHTRWFPLDELSKALVHHGNYLVSLHDFVAVCPRFHLFTVGGEHCTGRECEDACGFHRSFIDEYREKGEEILRGARERIAFSNNTHHYLEEILGSSLPVIQEQHGIVTSPVREKPLPKNPDEGPLTALVVAPVGRHKGQELFRKLFRVRHLPSGREIVWKVLGQWEKEADSAEELCGPFSPETLSERVAACRPDVGVLLSLCPETYGILFDELLHCGVPLVVGPLGAPAERVEQWNGGWVLEELSVSAVLEQLDLLAADPGGMAAKRNAASVAPVRSIRAEMESLAERYRKYLTGASSDPHHFQHYLKRFQLGAPLRSPASRLFGRGLDQVVALADRLSLRSLAQRTVERVCGRRVLQALKNIRG